MCIENYPTTWLLLHHGSATWIRKIVIYRGSSVFPNILQMVYARFIKTFNNQKHASCLLFYDPERYVKSQRTTGHKQYEGFWMTKVRNFTPINSILITWHWKLCTTMGGDDLFQQHNRCFYNNFCAPYCIRNHNCTLRASFQCLYYLVTSKGHMDGKRVLR